MKDSGGKGESPEMREVTDTVPGSVWSLSFFFLFFLFTLKGLNIRDCQNYASN